MSVGISNGTEGRAFEAVWCGTCIHDQGMRLDPQEEGCDLMVMALLGEKPDEWTPQDPPYFIHTPVVCSKWSRDHSITGDEWEIPHKELSR